VRCGGPGVLVCLHDIELRAPVSIDLVGVTVSVAISVHPEFAGFINAWHLDHVPGSDAATLVVAEVDVPLDRATKHVGLEELRVIQVERGGLSDVTTSI